MTLFATTQCSVVAGDAVTQTGQFRDLIAPTSPLSGGFDEAYAKTRWGIYPHSVHAATATHKAVAVSPTYSSGDDKVYVTELVEKTIADIGTEAEKKRDAISVERDRRIYLPIGQVDLNGDASLMVEPDIRNAGDRANLIAVHTRALSLVVDGVTAAVVKFGAADNVEYTLTPAQAVKLCEAPFDRASGLYAKARALKDGALQTAVDNGDIAALIAIDPTSDAHWS